MSTDRQNEKLDALLDVWSSEHSDGQQESESTLKQQILDGLDEQPTRHRDSIAQKALGLQPRNAWLVWALVASLLVAAGIGFSIWNSIPVKVDPIVNASQTIPVFASLSKMEIQAKQMLTQKCVGMFGGQFNGAVEFQGQLEMSLATDGGVASDTATLVRLVCARRPLNSTNGANAGWESVWTQDVIAMDENVIQVPGQNDQQPDLYVWAFRLPDGNISTDVSLNGDRFDELKLSGIHRRVWKPQETESLACSKADGFEYCIFQSVAALSAEVGG